MKTLQLFILLSFPFFAIGQSNSSIDVIGSLDYTYRTINGSGLIADIVKDSRDVEKGRLNWRAGFNYNQRLTDKLILKTGLRMAALGYKDKRDSEDFYTLRWGTQHNGNGEYDITYPSGEDIEFFETKTNHFFLEIPIVLRYEFSNNKFSPYVEAGFGAMYYLFQRHVATVNGDKTVTTMPSSDDRLSANSFQIESIIAVGANYNLNENLQFFGQPTFRYHLNSLWDTDVKERLWSAGLEIGLRKFLN
ncbi:MAG: outer membrane beta-barrel protein [Saprospiraceae bacterium]